MLHMLPGFLERHGASADYVFSRAGLRDSTDLRPTRIVARAQICALLSETARIVGDPLAGPNIVYGGINPARLGLTGQALFHGPTIYESLRAHARLMPTLQSNVQLGLKVRGDKAYWFLNFVGSDPDAMGVLTEGAITLVLEVIRHVVGAHWSPDYIEFSHQPRTTIDRYETRLRAPVRFRRGPASAIVLDSRILAVGAIACTRWRSSFLLLSEPNVYDASMFAEVVDLPRSPDQLIELDLMHCRRHVDGCGGLDA